MPGDANQPLRAPWKVALIAFGLTLLVGIIVGLVALFANPGGDAFARGEKLGDGLAKLAIAAAIVAHFVQQRRCQR